MLPFAQACEAVASGAFDTAASRPIWRRGTAWGSVV